jgi:hypothetical protein
MLGTYALSSGYYDAYYKKAQQLRRLVKNDLDQAFAKVDVLLSPTCPHTAFDIGSKVSDPLSMYLTDIATITANLAGIPAMNLPVGLDKTGMPIGIQLQAKALDEAKMLKYEESLAKEYMENATNLSFKDLMTLAQKQNPGAWKEQFSNLMSGAKDIYTRQAKDAVRKYMESYYKLGEPIAKAYMTAITV